MAPVNLWQRWKVFCLSQFFSLLFTLSIVRPVKNNWLGKPPSNMRVSTPAFYVVLFSNKALAPQVRNGLILYQRLINWILGNRLQQSLYSTFTGYRSIVCTISFKILIKPKAFQPLNEEVCSSNALFKSQKCTCLGSLICLLSNHCVTQPNNDGKVTIGSQQYDNPI